MFTGKSGSDRTPRRLEVRHHAIEGSSGPFVEDVCVHQTEMAAADARPRITYLETTGCWEDDQALGSKLAERGARLPLTRRVMDMFPPLPGNHVPPPSTCVAAGSARSKGTLSRLAYRDGVPFFKFRVETLGPMTYGR